MQENQRYYKVVIQSPDFKEEKPEHYVFINPVKENDTDEASILISLQFAASKDEVLKLLSDKPETIMENGNYYSDINWFIANTDKENERYSIFIKLKTDILQFMKDSVPPTAA